MSKAVAYVMRSAVAQRCPAAHPWHLSTLLLRINQTPLGAWSQLPLKARTTKSMGRQNGSAEPCALIKPRVFRSSCRSRPEPQSPQVGDALRINQTPWVLGSGCLSRPEPRGPRISVAPLAALLMAAEVGRIVVHAPPPVAHVEGHIAVRVCLCAVTKSLSSVQQHNHELVRHVQKKCNAKPTTYGNVVWFAHTAEVLYASRANTHVTNATQSDSNAIWCS